MLRLFDPRTDEAAVQVECHNGRRSARAVWCGRTNHILTTGFSNMQEREMKLWDYRQLNQPLTRVRVDTGTGVLMPFYDADTDLLFIGGKVYKMGIHIEWLY